MENLTLETLLSTLAEYGAFSRRTQNACVTHNIVTIGNLMALTERQALNWRGCGRKTVFEITSLQRLLRPQLPDEEVNRVSPRDASDLTTAPNEGDNYSPKKYALLFPFLKHSECGFLTTIEKAGYALPYVFIIEKYLQRQEGKRIRVYREMMGINAENRPKKLTEIALGMNITRERVRQLSEKTLKLSFGARRCLNMALRQIDWDIISENDPFWDEMRRTQYLNLTNLQLFAMASGMTRRFTLLKFGDEQFIVRARGESGAAIKECFDKVMAYLGNKHEVDVTLNIKDFIAANFDGSRADDYPLALDTLIFAINSCAARIKNINYADAENIEIKANSNKRLQSIERFVSKIGHVFTAKEAYGLYCQEYADISPLKYASFKAYLIKSDKIFAIGRSGRYAMPGWDNAFNGTLVELVANILEVEGKPLSLDVVTEMVRKVFPDTNAKSISTVIYIKNKEKPTFIRFNNDYIGLVEQDYGDDNRLKEKTIRSQRQFAENFARYVNFVNTHKHVPIANHSDEEGALYRWRYNVTRNRNCTDDEWQRLQDFIASTRRMPQSSSELKFKHKCDEIKAQIVQQGVYGLGAKRSPLRTWLNTQQRIAAELSENCRFYLDDCLAVLNVLQH